MTPGAGIAQPHQEGRPTDDSSPYGATVENVRQLYQQGVSMSEMAARLSVSETSVRRLLEP